MAISHCYWCLVVKNGNFTLLLMSSGQEWKLADLPQDLPADLPPKCIMGYILWDRFGSHFGFCKKKVGISCYFWILWVVNSQLQCTGISDITLLNTPWNPPKTPPKWQEISTLTGDICLEYQYTKLGRWKYFGRWTPWESNIDVWNTATPNLADKPTLADGPPT